MSIIGHLNSSSENSVAQKPSTEKIAKTVNELSLFDFFDLSKPWVLVPLGSFLGYFDYVPAHLRHGPWSAIATLSILTILYLLSVEGIKMYENGGFLRYFESSMSHDYEAFNREWHLTLFCFCWMLFVCWHVLAYSAIGARAWTTFTLWSWTLVTIRHGLCVVAPFIPSVRLPLDVLRFPALLSATLTFFLWNFVLFPIILFFLKDREKRSKFLSYMTNFRLTQLHVFNIFFAAANGVFVGPKRALHLGDVAAAVVLLVVYMLWYYCIMDRIGVHLYPIFSPRTPFVVCSYVLLFGICYGGFQGWQQILAML
jgi:hypothetical protein